MTKEQIDRISIIIIFLCFAGLIFVFINSRRKEKADIDYSNMCRLKDAIPKQASESAVMGIKKSRWVPVCIFLMGYRVGVEIIFGGLGYLYGPSRFIRAAVITLIGLLLAFFWVLFDIYQTKKVDDKVIIPGYVQSTFTNPKYHNKTAQLIYYDYVRNKYRLKRIPINRFEKKYGEIYSGDKVDIIAMEKTNYVKCVDLYRREIGY